MARSEALEIKVLTNPPTQGGVKVLTGSVGMANNYYTDGNTMDLSDHYGSDSSPVVIIAPTGGYTFEHNQGTAAAGKVMARLTTQNAINAAADNTVLVQVDVNTDISTTNALFVAYGEPR